MVKKQCKTRSKGSNSQQKEESDQANKFRGLRKKQAGDGRETEAVENNG